MSAVFSDQTDIDLTVHDRRSGAARTPLRIPILASTGSGPTALAAFDAALLGAGIANYNLIRLSSVIPPSTVIDATDGAPWRTPGHWGDRLYCVFARQDATTRGDEAWAGISWVQDPQTGAGLFVEHEGSSEAHVRRDMAASIDSLCRNRGIRGLVAQSVVTGVICESEPVCAMVIAPYQAESWR